GRERYSQDEEKATSGPLTMAIVLLIVGRHSAAPKGRNGEILPQPKRGKQVSNTGRCRGHCAGPQIQNRAEATQSVWAGSAGQAAVPPTRPKKRLPRFGSTRLLPCPLPEPSI